MTRNLALNFFQLLTKLIWLSIFILTNRFNSTKWRLPVLTVGPDFQRPRRFVCFDCSTSVLKQNQKTWLNLSIEKCILKYIEYEYDAWKILIMSSTAKTNGKPHKGFIEKLVRPSRLRVANLNPNVEKTLQHALVMLARK